MEKSIANVDERYRNVLERLVKVEESLSNVSKQVDINQYGNRVQDDYVAVYCTTN